MHPASIELPEASASREDRPQCRVCGGSVLAPLYRIDRDGNHIVECCRDCGFTQLQHPPSEAELAAIYGMSYFEDRKYGLDISARNEQARRLALLAEGGILAGAKVLDLGCATGDFLLAAKEHFDVWGIDVSSHAVEIARRRMPDLADRLHKGTLLDAGFPPGYFDAVVLWDAIEHLWQPRPVIEHIATLLRPDGMIFLSTPNIGAPLARLLGRRWPFMTPPEHLGYFNRGSLRRLLDTCGFEERMWTSRGKWVNVGFMFYKLRRVFPSVPERLVRALQTGSLGRAVLYVPSGDIMYVGARKR